MKKELSWIDKTILKLNKGKVKSFLFWSFCVALYVCAFFVAFCPIGENICSNFLGSFHIDLLNEMWLHPAVLEATAQGHFNCTDSTNFPKYEDLLNTHLSYLHVYFTALSTLFLSWPLWFNIAVLCAVTANASSVCWVIVRITGQRLFGLLAGLIVIFSPSILVDIYKGYLCQIWCAPMFVAFCFLYETVYKEKKYSWIWLSFWTVISACVFWLNGLFLTIGGVITIIASLRIMTKLKWKRVLFAVILTAVVISPFAVMVFNSQPVVRQAVDSGLSYGLLLQAVERSMATNVPLYFLTDKGDSSVAMSPVTALSVSYPLSGFLPYALLLTFLALLFWEWKTKKGFALAFLLTFVFYVLSWGPFLEIGPGLLANGNGEKIPLPFYYLIAYFPILCRWSFPARLIPGVILFSAVAIGAVLKVYSGNMTLVKRGALFIALLTFYSWFVFQLTFIYYGNYPPVCKAAYVPSYCSYLKEHKPDRNMALADLPLGFVVNTHQNYKLHLHKIVQSRQCQVPLLLGNSSFFAYMFMWNQDAVKQVGLNMDIMLKGKGTLADLVPYGIRSASLENPELLQILDKEKLASVEKNIVDPNLNNAFGNTKNKLSKEAVLEDYAQNYQLGLRYIVINRANCFWIDSEKGGLIFAQLKNIAQEHFGNSIYSDYQNAVYLMPNPKDFAALFTSKYINMHKDMLSL